MPSELGESYEELIYRGFEIADELGEDWRRGPGTEFMDCLINAKRILDEVKKDLTT